MALQPGETRQVFFGVQARQLALVNERGERWLQPGRYRLGLDVPTRQWRDIELTGLTMQFHTDGAAASTNLVLMSALIQRRHRAPDCASHRYGICAAQPYAWPSDGPMDFLYSASSSSPNSTGRKNCLLDSRVDMVIIE